METIARNAFFNVIHTLLNLLFPFFTSIYAARILFAEGVGRVAYAQGIVTYFLSLAEFGLSVYGIREIAKARGDAAKTNKTFTELFVINFVTTTAALCAYCACLFLTKDLTGQMPLFLVCGSSIFFQYFNVEWLYQGKENYVDIAVRNMAVKVLAAAAMLLFVRTAGDYVRYALIISMACGGSYVLNLLSVRKYVRLDWEGFAVQKHVKSLLVVAASTFVRTCYGRIDTTMLGILSTNAMVGYYSYASTIRYTSILLCISIPKTFFSRLSFDYENDRDEFQELLQLMVDVLVFLSFPACAGIFLLAPQIVFVLFGESFSRCVGMLRILSVIIPVICFEELLCHQVRLVEGDGEERIPAYAAASFGRIVLHCFVIPAMSGEGAAAVSVISELAVSVYLLYRTRRKIHFFVSKKVLGQALFSTAIMGMAVRWTVRADVSELLQCAAGAAVGIFVYGVVNLTVKNHLMLLGIEKIKKRKGTK